MKPINFFAPINQDTFNGLMQEIGSTNEDYFINFASSGGDVSVAFRMYNYFRSLDRKIIFRNTGDVSSAAVIVFLAADQRLAYSNSIFMIHRLACELSGSFNVKELNDRIQSLEFDIDRYYNILAERTSICSQNTDRTGTGGNDLDTLAALRGERELLFNAKDALSAGIITGISDI